MGDYGHGDHGNSYIIFLVLILLLLGGHGHY